MLISLIYRKHFVVRGKHDETVDVRTPKSKYKICETK